MSRQNELRWKVIGILGKLVLGLWSKSCRLTVFGEEEYRRVKKEGRPIIFLIWHGRLMFAPHFFRHHPVVPLISPSRDGEIITQVGRRWGYRIIRGSGSHAIIRAWNELKNELEKGGEVLFVPDGPRGPGRELKPGCLKLAQETGAFLLPLSFSASRKKFLNSWDNFLLFYPFSRVVAIYGRPVAVESGLEEETLEKERKKVELLLTGLDARADAYFER